MSSISGGASGVNFAGAVGPWPALAAKEQTFAESFFRASGEGARLKGFVGDGDYIRLPDTYVGDMEYFNASDVLQWGVSCTDLNAACDHVLGYAFDGTDIYIGAVDDATTSNTYYFAKVDPTGTVTMLGTSIKPGTDFEDDTANWWHANSVGNSTSHMYIDPVGGNLIVQQNHASGIMEMEVNIVTGAKVSNPALVGISTGHLMWKTSDGIYGSMISSYYYPVFWTEDLGIAVGYWGYDHMNILVSNGQSNQMRNILWGDEVYSTVFSGAANSYLRVYDLTEVEAWYKACYLIARGVDALS